MTVSEGENNLAKSMAVDPLRSMSSPHETMYSTQKHLKLSQQEMDNISILKESARTQNKFGLTRAQHEEYMQKLDKIRPTRVDQNLTRKHVRSVHRVRRKLTQLKKHYGNSSMMMANPFDCRSELVTRQVPPKSNHAMSMRITENDENDTIGQEFNYSHALGPLSTMNRDAHDRGIMTHMGFRVQAGNHTVKNGVV